VPLARSKTLLRKIPMRLHALDRCGHLPMLEQPGAFNQIVADFLRAALAAPAPPRRRGVMFTTGRAWS
jgi:hypothetical protein